MDPSLPNNFLFWGVGESGEREEGCEICVSLATCMQMDRSEQHALKQAGGERSKFQDLAEIELDF